MSVSMKERLTSAGLPVVAVSCLRYHHTTDQEVHPMFPGETVPALGDFLVALSRPATFADCELVAQLFKTSKIDLLDDKSGDKKILFIKDGVC